MGQEWIREGGGARKPGGQRAGEQEVKTGQGGKTGADVGGARQRCSSTEEGGVMQPNINKQGWRHETMRKMLCYMTPDPHQSSCFLPPLPRIWFQKPVVGPGVGRGRMVESRKSEYKTSN